MEDNLNRPVPNSVPEKPKEVPHPTPDREQSSIHIWQENYSGPIPPPQWLQVIEGIIPGGAQRILALTEKEQSHRHKIIERRVLTHSWQVKVSLVGGLLTFLLLILGILYCAAHDYKEGVIALGSLGAFGVISHIINLPQKFFDKKKDKQDS